MLLQGTGCNRTSRRTDLSRCKPCRSYGGQPNPHPVFCSKLKGDDIRERPPLAIPNDRPKETPGHRTANRDATPACVRACVYAAHQPAKLFLALKAGLVWSQRDLKSLSLEILLARKLAKSDKDRALRGHAPVDCFWPLQILS